ncbi:MAG: LTA synthase family protein [Acetivibrio ethanolgignens]
MMDKINWKKWTPKLGELLLALATPLLMFLQVELLEKNQLYNIREPFYFINYLWYALILGLLLLALRRLRYALMTAGVISYVIGLANHYVLEFRGIPILPWDFKSFGTAMDVAGNYDYSFDSYTWAVTLVTACYLLLVHFSVSKDRIEVKSKKYAAIFSTYLVFAGVVWYLHSNFGLLGMHNWTVFAWNQKIQYQCCGVAASFMENLRFMDVGKPADYDPEKIRQLALEYAEEQREKEDIGATKKPNIIAIMDESFADISMIKDLGEDAEYMPFFDSLTENTIRGNLNVSAFGGNTCNTEFEFLTSLSMAFLPSGSVPYQQYVDRDLSSLCRILKKQGYSATAIHPCKASNWNRDKVYPYLGFDEFISENDFSPENTSYLRGYMSDQADFDQLIEEYEKRRVEGPAFLFNVTMQNHGGYDGGTQMYINLIRETDKELKWLIEYFEEQPEPILLLFFGDHQPNLQDGTYDGINEETDMSVYRNKYLVPFVIWANYDIEESTVGDTSPGFLAPLLLQTAGLSMPPYYHLLLDNRKDVPAISINGHMDAASVWIDPRENGKDEITALYEQLQYNKLFDKKNYVAEMFEFMQKNLALKY